jgi:hypothetical protein
MNLLGHSSGQGAACQALNLNRLAGIWPAFGEGWFLTGKNWPVPAKLAKNPRVENGLKSELVPERTWRAATVGKRQQKTAKYSHATGCRCDLVRPGSTADFSEGYTNFRRRSRCGGRFC